MINTLASTTQNIGYPSIMTPSNRQNKKGLFPSPYTVMEPTGSVAVYCNGPSEPNIGSERQHESAVFLAQMKQWHFLN